MPRTDLAYEKPSRVSQCLVVGFSIAVVVMAGWLVMMIMFPPDAGTLAAGEADIQMASTPPYVENVSPEPIRLSATARSNSTYPEPSPWAYAPNSAAPPAPPRSALSLASPAELPVSAPSPAYTPSSIPAGAPEVNYRGILADELPRQAEAIIEATDTTPDFIPLPLPKPHRTASIPVPRPRPRLDGEDAQSSSDQSFFDFLVNRQR